MIGKRGQHVGDVEVIGVVEDAVEASLFLLLLLADDDCCVVGAGEPEDM